MEAHVEVQPRAQAALGSEWAGVALGLTLGHPF